MKPEMKMPTALAKAVKIVSEVHDVHVDLLRFSQLREHAEARRIVYAIIRKYARGITFKTIGETVSGANHATIIHAIDALEDCANTDKTTKRNYEECKAQYLAWIDPDRKATEERIDELEARLRVLEAAQKHVLI